MPAVLTTTQKLSLEALLSAFRDAAECGALDILNEFQRDPDSINDVVEALEEVFAG